MGSAVTSSAGLAGIALLLGGGWRLRVAGRLGLGRVRVLGAVLRGLAHILSVGSRLVLLLLRGLLASIRRLLGLWLLVGALLLLLGAILLLLLTRCAVVVLLLLWLLLLVAGLLGGLL